MNNKISVILPCYNEEKIIEDTLKKVLNFSKKNPSYEFIFVDDGSKDKTLSLLKKYASNPKIKVVSYNPNQGKGHAVKRGIMKAQGGYIIFTDSDLAYSLSHLELVTKELASSQVVIGSRALSSKTPERTSLFKIIRGVTYNILSRIVLGLSYQDMQAGLKGFHGNVAKKIFSKQQIKNFSFDPEVIYIAKKHNYKITEIPAEVSEDHKEKSSQIKLFRDPAKMLLGLFEIKLNELRGKYE